MSGLVLTADIDGWDEVIERVLGRDRRCVFADTGPILKIGAQPHRSPFLGHFCRDRWGRPINWFRSASIGELHALGAVELDHVKEEPKMGQKAPDDEAHLVVVCKGAHERLATSHPGREFERYWLAALYPDVWATFLERRGGTPDAMQLKSLAEGG